MFIEEKKGAWDEHKKVHPDGVKLLKGKTFPWLPRWNILFGKDKATGKHSVDVSDAFNELRSGSHMDSQSGNPKQMSDTHSANSNNVVEVDDKSTLPADDDEFTESKLRRKRKKCNQEDTNIEKMVGEIMSSTRLAIGDIAESLKQPPPQPNVSSDGDDVLKKGLYEAVSMLPGLSLEEVMWAVSYLTNSRKDMLAFYGIPVEVRPAYVVMLIRKAK